MKKKKTDKTKKPIKIDENVLVKEGLIKIKRGKMKIKRSHTCCIINYGKKLKCPRCVMRREG